MDDGDLQAQTHHSSEQFIIGQALNLYVRFDVGGGYTDCVSFRQKWRKIIMSWVPTVPEEQAMGPLADVYRKARERAGKVPNITKLQSFRPETTARGFDLYCQIMDAPTGLTRRERVLIATIVSKVNGCLY